VGDGNHFVFRQKLLGDDGSERRGIIMVKQSDLFSPKLGATSSHVFMQSPQNLAVETGIHSLVFGTGALRYHNCCIDGGTSPDYFRYHFVVLITPTKIQILLFLYCLEISQRATALLL
jgi:hypothetical protein